MIAQPGFTAGGTESGLQGSGGTRAALMRRDFGVEASESQIISLYQDNHLDY